jgi:2-phospho-L-lactate transferase/gluconeogenesis factor (CofD/UPF0052 family)
VVVLIANLVREQSEAVGLDLIDHVAVIEDHAGAAILDAVLVHEGPLDPGVVARYRDEGAIPLAWPTDGPARPLIVRRNLVAEGFKLRHDPQETARALIETWAVLDRAQERVGDKHA